MEPKGNAASVPLLRCEGQADPRSGDDRAPRRARNTARVEGRAHRPDIAREAPGRGHRQRGPQAVPLPRRVPRPAGGDEVRGADPVRRKAPRPAARDGRAPDAGSARSAARLRGRDPADQPRVVPRRLRPAHQALPNLRRDDAQQIARQGSRESRHVPLPCQGQGAGPHGGRRHRARRLDPSPPRHAGRRLFRYEVDGELCNLSSRRLNEYVQEFMSEDFSCKDFRTWGGTLTAAIAFAERGPVEGKAAQKRAVAVVMRTVGERLGNTPAVARASYVSPAVVEQYLDGRTIEDFRPLHLRIVTARDIGLDQEEQATLSLLRSWRIRESRKAA